MNYGVVCWPSTPNDLSLILKHLLNWGAGTQDLTLQQESHGHASLSQLLAHLDDSVLSPLRSTWVRKLARSHPAALVWSLSSPLALCVHL